MFIKASLSMLVMLAVRILSLQSMVFVNLPVKLDIPFEISTGGMNITVKKK
jgi:hypothetical protein